MGNSTNGATPIRKISIPFSLYQSFIAMKGFASRGRIGREKKAINL
jgi:hypothetical protein